VTAHVGHSGDKLPPTSRLETACRRPATVYSKDHQIDKPSLTRAHDNTIDDKRYRYGNETRAETRPETDRNATASRPLDDGIDAPYVEEELKVRYEVEFIHTPCNERAVFKNAKYIGETRIVNGKFGYAYRAHLWYVEYVTIGCFDFEMPLPAIMQITAKRWRNAELPHPRTAFEGTSSVTANNHRQIVQIESRLEARQ